MNKVLIAILLVASLNNLSYAQDEDDFRVYASVCDVSALKQIADETQKRADNFPQADPTGGLLMQQAVSISNIRTYQCLTAKEVLKLKNKPINERSF